MQANSLSEENGQRNMRSRIGQALVRLNQTLQRIDTQQEQTERRWKRWQKKWSRQFAQLSGRLEWLEYQLDTSADEVQSPPLGLIGVPESDDRPIQMSEATSGESPAPHSNNPTQDVTA